MQDASAGIPGPGADYGDFPIVITTLPSSARHYKIAYIGSIILVAVIAIMMPLATVQLRQVDAFVPVIQTVMCITDLVTAALLFAHYRIKPQRALLTLAGGFVSSGLLAFLQTLAFPGAYGPGAAIGDGSNSASWLFVVWQTVFPLAVIVYALWKDTVHWPPRSTSVSIGITIACVVTATAALAWVATTGIGHLPVIYYQTEDQRGHFAIVAGVYLLLMTTIALGLLFVRRHTILDQWLIVRLLAWCPLFVAATFSVGRFTLGWYIARVYALFAGSSLLFVLLTETLFLYTRLAKAVLLLRESERHQRLLIAELDHRVKNTLAQVAAVATSTREASGSIDDFVRSLSGRLQSAAAAHTLLSESRWKTVSLDALVRTELAPYTTRKNIEIVGTDVMLGSAETQALAKVLHELATNAAKYGALSIPDGRVSVSWDHQPSGRSANLVLEWREVGGPAVISELQSGYGTSLIRELIPHELGGDVDLVFGLDGAFCKIKFPLEHVSSDPADQALY